MSLAAFDCQKLHARLTPQACVARQDVRHKHGSAAGERPLSFRMCDPATCDVGRANREAVEQAQRDAAGGPLQAIEGFDTFDLTNITPPPAKPPALAPVPCAPAEATPAPQPEAPPVLAKPDKTKTCKTDGCSNGVQFPKIGLCRACYNRQRDEKLNGPKKQCRCGVTIRKDSPYDTCTGCRGTGDAPVAPKKTTPTAKKAAPGKAEEQDRCEGCGKPATHCDVEGVPLCRACWSTCDVRPPEPKRVMAIDDLSKISNDELATFITAALTERARRLSGLEQLRAAGAKEI